MDKDACALTCNVSCRGMIGQAARLLITDALFSSSNLWSIDRNIFIDAVQHLSLFRCSAAGYILRQCGFLWKVSCAMGCHHSFCQPLCVPIQNSCQNCERWLWSVIPSLNGMFKYYACVYHSILFYSSRYSAAQQFMTGIIPWSWNWVFPKTPLFALVCFIYLHIKT